MTMIFFYINDDVDESDEIYVYAICVYEEHLNSFLNMLSFFLIFLYEKMRKKIFF